MSSSDSDSEPHFETIVTTALVEPEKSFNSSLNYRTFRVETIKSSTNFKKNRILRDLDAIEVISDHNNNEFNCTTDKSFSYEAFKNQLSIDKENSKEELHPLTSTRIKSVVPKSPQKKKFALQKEPKPGIKRGPGATRYQYTKKVNSIESDSEYEIFIDKFFKIVQKEPTSKSVKREGPVVGENKVFKKFKPRENRSNVHPTQSYRQNVLPVAKPKQCFVVEDLIGHAKQKEDFWSLWNLSKPLKLDSNPQPSDGLKTLKSQVCAPEKPILEDSGQILTKPKPPSVGGNLVRRAQNNELDYFSSLLSLNSSELEANHKPKDESRTLKNEIAAPTKSDCKNGVKILSVYNLNTNVEIHPAKLSAPTRSSKEMQVSNTGLNEITEVNCKKSQKEHGTLKNQSNVDKKHSTEELYSLRSTSVKSPQKKIIALKKVPKYVKRGPIATQYQHIKTFNNLESSSEDENWKELSKGVQKKTKPKYVRKEAPDLGETIFKKSKARNGRSKVYQTRSFHKTELPQTEQSFVVENLVGHKRDDDFSSLSSLNTSEINAFRETKNVSAPINSSKETQVLNICSSENSVDVQNESFNQFKILECTESGLLMKDKIITSDLEISEWITTGVHENMEDEIFKQAECRLKEISIFVQNSLDVLNGPITLKNHKMYNFLLDLENKLNAHFSENSDLDEKDFNNLVSASPS